MGQSNEEPMQDSKKSDREREKEILAEGYTGQFYKNDEPEFVFPERLYEEGHRLRREIQNGMSAQEEPEVPKEAPEQSAQSTRSEMPEQGEAPMWGEEPPQGGQPSRSEMPERGEAPMWEESSAQRELSKSVQPEISRNFGYDDLAPQRDEDDLGFINHRYQEEPAGKPSGKTADRPKTLQHSPIRKRQPQSKSSQQGQRGQQPQSKSSQQEQREQQSQPKSSQQGQQGRQPQSKSSQQEQRGQQPQQKSSQQGQPQRKPQRQRPEVHYTPAQERPMERRPIRRRRTSDRRRRNRQKIFLRAFVLLIFILLISVVYIYYQGRPYRAVKESYTMEAGSPCPTVADFLERGQENAYIVSGISSSMTFNQVKDYEVVVHVYNKDVSTILHVVDTVAPKLKTKNQTIILGEPFTAEDFVESVSDVTSCKVQFGKETEVTSGGTYTLFVMATDEGGNSTEELAYLEVLQDVTPPVISGVKELSIMVGESVSYKRDVTVTDDFDENVPLEIDNSEVDTGIPGDYNVIYRATDTAGNTTEITTVLHVKSTLTVDNKVTPGVPVTVDSVNEAADKILESITNPDMTQYEVIKAIYNWCHSKIAYVDGTPKTSWVEGAYCGIIQRKGDCYAYAMSAKCLLDRAGIVNMDIERVRVRNGMHFWNLVDIGEGWHHFDTCRRADGSTFFYLTDAQLMEYSDKHTAPDYPNGTHYYDRTLYPEIP